MEKVGQYVERGGSRAVCRRAAFARRRSGCTALGHHKKTEHTQSKAASNSLKCCSPKVFEVKTFPLWNNSSWVPVTDWRKEIKRRVQNADLPTRLRNDCVSIKGCYVTGSMFSPLTSSHSKKKGCDCCKYWMVYSDCNNCTRCHQAVDAFVEVSFLH